ncbi:MAG: site-2 protease family protein [Treponema sp.]|nr:site-2 protease family protein [Treponema sp.]
MNWANILISMPGVILGLTLHEFCHALAADRLGDHTAREQGRLSFNPLKHIDPVGFLFLIFAGFGWAKPVQFNPANLKHYRRDKALIAAAGPLSNFLFALFLIMLIRGYLSLNTHLVLSENWDAFYILNSNAVSYTIWIIIQAVSINLGLFIFNLIPLPPLDGSHIFLSGLNLSPETEYRIMRIGGPLLFIIIIIQNFAKINILPIGKLTMAILYLFIPELKTN